MSLSTKVPIDIGAKNTIPSKGPLYAADVLDGATDVSDGWAKVAAPDFGATHAGSTRANDLPTPPGGNRPLDGQHKASFAGAPGSSEVID